MITRAITGPERYARGGAAIDVRTALDAIETFVVGG